MQHVYKWQYVYVMLYKLPGDLKSNNEGFRVLSQ